MSVDLIKKALLSIDSIDDLRKVQSLIHSRADYLQRASTSQFSMGQKVSFISSRTGRKIVGRITKINQKTVSIMTDESHSWKVSASLLRRE
jgi:hypothetical protein